MPEAENLVCIADRQGVKLVRLRAAALLTEDEVEALGQALMALAEMPGQRVVLSFLGVTHITSVVLNTLVLVQRRLEESGGDLRLADIDPHVFEMFAITRLDRKFRIFERDEDAVASFLAGPEG